MVDNYFVYIHSLPVVLEEGTTPTTETREHSGSHYQVIKHFPDIRITDEEDNIKAQVPYSQHSNTRNTRKTLEKLIRNFKKEWTPQGEEDIPLMIYSPPPIYRPRLKRSKIRKPVYKKKGEGDVAMILDSNQSKMFLNLLGKIFKKDTR